MAERRWYRLHLVTWLFVFIVGAALVWSQFHEELLRADGTWWYVDSSCFGWPFVSVFQTTKSAIFEFVIEGGDRPKTTRIPPKPPTWLPGAILLNSLVCVLVIGSTVFVLEKWSRSAKRTQFTIVNLLGLITVAAILLMIINQREAIYEYFGEPLMPSEVLEEGRIAASVARIPILFGLACTIYTVGWLAFRLAACSVSALRSLIARRSKD